MARLSFAVSVCFMCFFSPACAGAWLEPEGGHQIIYQTSYSFARRSYGPESVKCFHKLIAKVYYEHGVSDRITVFTIPQYTLATVRSVYGLTLGRDYAISSGIRLGLLSGENILSAEVSYSYGQAFALTVSEGNTSSQQADIRLLYGHNFYISGRKIFIDAEGFWRWTAPPRPNETGFDVTAGVSLNADTYILVQNFSVLSAGYGASAYPHYTLHKAEVSVVQSLYDGWQLQLGGLFAYAGHNVVAERGVTMALWLSL